jgi:uncharacterized membrane protein YsdA (DUF1294 family)
VRNRNFTLFGVLAIILAAALFLVFSRAVDWQWYWLWLGAANIVTFLFYGYDKMSSKAGTGRIPELLLHLLALAGGFAGALLGMGVFHHKTNFREHPLFLPIIVIGGVIWAVIIYYLLTQPG